MFRDQMHYLIARRFVLLHDLIMVGIVGLRATDCGIYFVWSTSRSVAIHFYA